MSRTVIIDGNNLLHAVHAYAGGTNIGRESLARRIDGWARRGGASVALVFDGATPSAGLAKQMSSERVAVQFSCRETADDVIIRMVESAERPASLRVVSTDSVIKHAAKYRKCACTDSSVFAAELFATVGENRRDTTQPSDAETATDGPAQPNTGEWLDTFDVEIDDEPFDGFDAMTGEG